MRRILALILALLMCSIALAAEGLQALDLALQLAEAIPEMSDVRRMPLEDGTTNRAIWSDARGNEKCALIVYPDGEAAQDAVLDASTRTTAVRAVGSCALYIHRDLGAEAISAYHLALAEILGETIDASDPDYILNESTRRIHFPSCRAIDQMNGENKYAYIGGRDALIAHGYDPCGICKP